MAEKSEKIIEQALKKKPQKTTREDVEFYPSGITLLDLCLGGGFGKGYISNICGWEAAGKTMVACATLGFNHNKNKDFKHKFDNAESGFTLNTKQLFNFIIDFIVPRSEKVEHFMFNFENILRKLKEGQNLIYILDSLDGLSDDREEEKHKKDMIQIRESIKENKGSNIKGDYSGKAKGMSQFLRQNNAKINKTKMHLLITSQLRDNVGVIFGKKVDRSGGKALNYYAAQIIWLKVIQKITRSITISGSNYERKSGTLIKANITKNKLGKAFRDCFLFFDLDLGIDNIKSNIYFLYNLISLEGELRKITSVIIGEDGKKEKINKLVWDDKRFSLDGLIKYIEENNLESELEKRVISLWNEIEEKITIKRKRIF